MSFCISCGFRYNLYTIELYDDEDITQNIHCCKYDEECKKKVWDITESMTHRKTQEDYDNGVEVWKTLFPNKKIPKKLLGGKNIKIPLK